MIESLLQISEPVRPVVRNNQASIQWIATSSLHDGSLWLRQAQKKLQKLAALPENWDSYGSPPVQSGALEKAGALISLLSDLKTPQPEIFPVSGAGLQLELRSQQQEIEIEILPDGSVEYLLVDGDRQMREGTIPVGSTGDIYRLIYWFGKEHSRVIEF